MAQTKVKSELIDGGLGTDWQSTIQTSSFTAEAGKGYFVNTTSGVITVTLPAGVVGSEIVLQDYARTFDTNKRRIWKNPKKNKVIKLCWRWIFKFWILE